MKLLELDEAQCTLRLRLEVVEDTYFTSLIIDPGDLVTAWTFRQVKVERTTGTERGERVRVKLTIMVKKVDFQRFGDRLRVLGVVVDAPEWLHIKGSHHTITLGVGDEVLVKKRVLLPHHRRVLSMATSRIRPLAVISVGDEVAVGLIRPQGIEVISTIPLPKPSKEGSLKAQVRKPLLKALANALESVSRHAPTAVVIAAPPLLLEAAMEVLKELSINVKVYSMGVSEGGLAGIYELLRREDAGRVFEEVRADHLREAVSQLLAFLEKDERRVALGLDEVELAANMSAVRVLLLVDEILLTGDRSRVLSVLEKAARTLRDIVVVPLECEYGRLLRSFGGIAALLYFPLERVARERL